MSVPVRVCGVDSRYGHLSREELLELLKARDRRDATRFGLVWEANEIERDKALNNDFVALDLVPELTSSLISSSGLRDASGKTGHCSPTRSSCSN